MASWLAGLLCGAIGACFAAPTDAVLFSCERGGDDQCPPEYQCEADNCCHRVGSDVEANFGSCALGGNSADATGSPAETGAETGTETGTGG